MKAASGTLSGSARRIQKELAELTHEPPENVSAGPKGDNIYEWAATIVGPAGTPYANGIFFVDVSIPTDYPFKPPRVHCRNKVYHLNFSSAGHIKLASVCDHQWSPAYTILQVLLSICELLRNPNVEMPVQTSIAHQLLTDRAKHDETAADWTRRFAQG